MAISIFLHTDTHTHTHTHTQRERESGREHSKRRRKQNIPVLRDGVVTQRVQHLLLDEGPDDRPGRPPLSLLEFAAHGGTVPKTRENSCIIVLCFFPQIRLMNEAPTASSSSSGLCLVFAPQKKKRSPIRRPDRLWFLWLGAFTIFLVELVADKKLIVGGGARAPSHVVK